MVDIERLIEDRASDGVFRVHRDVFRDRAVFDLEVARVFEGTWIFVGLESQLPATNDFFTSHIGRQPILVTRDRTGELHCFLNTCRHRGTIVCPFADGNAALHVCRYHGWSYDAAGRNRAITDEADGQYPAAFRNADHDLLPVARFGNYRGLLFASLSAEVPSLEEHLGDARVFLDIVLDQSDKGFECVPGPVIYTYEANLETTIRERSRFLSFQHDA